MVNGQRSNHDGKQQMEPPALLSPSFCPAPCNVLWQTCNLYGPFCSCSDEDPWQWAGPVTSVEGRQDISDFAMGAIG